MPEGKEEDRTQSQERVNPQGREEAGCQHREKQNTSLEIQSPFKKSALGTEKGTRKQDKQRLGEKDLEHPPKPHSPCKTAPPARPFPGRERVRGNVGLENRVCLVPLEMHKKSSIPGGGQGESVKTGV